MKTNKNEIKNQPVEISKQRTGFNTSIMPVMGKTGEYVYFFLPAMALRLTVPPLLAVT